ncbi:hypothetical protein EBOKLHFM_00018 [Klebsiella phage KP13-26]|nr:hypothetical protein EBOKLHFM_00018 [Klebsiella phage KP13-26]
MKLLTSSEIHTILTTNIQDWKKYADIENVQDLNSSLKDTDVLYILVSPDFYDDINDVEQELESVLDKHFLPFNRDFKRESYILMHNIYNK